jgi:hypothetical protein
MVRTIGTFMIKIILENKTMLVASRWYEVNLYTVLYYLRYYYTRLGELITTNEKGESFVKDNDEWLKMHFGLLEGLFGKDGRKTFKSIDGITATSLVEEHKVTDFLVKELLPFRQLVKEIRGFYGPLEFNHLTTSEFALADIQFLLAKNAIKKGDELALLTHLRLFTAVLYREKTEKKFGDTREIFDKQTVELRVKELERKISFKKGSFGSYGTNKWLMLAALLWYESHRLALPRKYPHAFEGGDGESKGLPDWQAAMLTVAETGTFGDFYKVEQTPVNYFIKEIDRKRKIIKEQIKEMEKAKEK